MADAPMLPAETAGAASVDQAAKLAFLRQPSRYPEATAAVEIRETHMSWVFLTERHAYKLKKPVRHDFLDFSTVDDRHRFCEEELRLNRRLAPDVYLAVVPLMVTAQGRLSLGGAGEPIDWLVKMRRLPESRMLDSAIRAGHLQPSEIAGLAQCLEAFYRTAPRISLSCEDYRQRELQAIDGNRVELRRYCAPAMRARIDRIAGAQRRYVETHADTFDTRVRGGNIVEGHGDLRPEHVFLGPPPQIIDCLEFKRDFRIVDIADDLALLAVECDRLGASEVGQALFRIPGVRNTPSDLIDFYKSYRAGLRAKLAIWHLKDEGVIDPASWQERAAHYLAIADQQRLDRT